MFGVYRSNIRPILSRMRIRLEWEMSDGSHQEEVHALMKALEEKILANVEAVIDAED